MRKFDTFRHKGLSSYLMDFSLDLIRVGRGKLRIKVVELRYTQKM